MSNQINVEHFIYLTIYKKKKKNVNPLIKSINQKDI